MKKFLLALLFFVQPLYANISEVRPFETDYCTMFIEGNWGSCCLEHDLRYWVGGTKENQFQSDLKLRSCVKEAAGPVWANVIYHGVRLGHYSPIKNKYKWSWGWEDPARAPFSALTKEEKAVAVAEIRRSTLEPQVIESFVKELLGQ